MLAPTYNLFGILLMIGRGMPGDMCCGVDMDGLGSKGSGRAGGGGGQWDGRWRLMGLLVDKVVNNIVDSEFISIEGDNKLLVRGREILWEDNDHVLISDSSTNVLDLEGKATDVCNPGYHGLVIVLGHHEEVTAEGEVCTETMQAVHILKGSPEPVRVISAVGMSQL